MPNQYTPKPSINERELRGQAIAQNFGWVRRVDETTYMVHSQMLDTEYRVEQTETGWVCDCPDSMFRLVKCKHVADIRLSGQVHNNKCERQNGEWRDREKVMRSLKREDSPVLKGMQIHHNFIRPHMGLHGRTPAEVAGIKVEGENKWLTIIQNAAKSKVTKLDGEDSGGQVTPT